MAGASPARMLGRSGSSLMIFRHRPAATCGALRRCVSRHRWLPALAVRRVHLVGAHRPAALSADRAAAATCAHWRRSAHREPGQRPRRAHGRRVAAPARPSAPAHGRGTCAARTPGRGLAAPSRRDRCLRSRRRAPCPAPACWHDLDLPRIAWIRRSSAPRSRHASRTRALVRLALCLVSSPSSSGARAIVIVRA